MFSHPFLQKLNAQNLDKTALIFEDEKCSYKNLLDLTKAKIKELESVPKGSCVGILGDFDKNSIAFLLANLERKNIIAPFADEKELENKLNEGQIDFLYTKNSLKILNAKPQKHELLSALKTQNKNGLILFSSGSTGRPKAVVHDLDRLLSVYLAKKPKDINILLFLLFDHIGGLNTLFNALSLSACAVAIKDRKSVEAIAKAIEKYRIFMLPASPSLLNLVILSDVKSKFDLSSLKLITYGTEKMPDALLMRLKAAFPRVKFHQTFGTSEVGITQTRTHENAIKLENIDYKIKNGELFLKSNAQALGYLNADNSVFDEDGYFATGDLVELLMINGEEFIRILGRTKELINVGGEKVLPQEVEGVIMQMPFISDCLVFGEQNAITGQSVSVKIVLDMKNPAFKEKFGVNLLNLSLNLSENSLNFGGNFALNLSENSQNFVSNSNKNSQNLSLNSSENSLNLGGNSTQNCDSNLSENSQNFTPNLSTKNLPQISNLELKKQIRAFCKDKLANFKIPTKVEIVENLAVSERFKKVRKI